jgi:putative heme-binding domain-containing protein
MPLLLKVCLVALAAFPLLAADPFAEGVRTTPWLKPEEQQKKFRLPPGFQIQLVASEPDIIKPMNMAFDARGRIWVTVTREYPYAAPLDKPSRDAIKILEDTNGDGKVDKITTFADGLNIPTGIYPCHGGCMAWSIPNIWLFKDTNGDDKADTRDVLFGPLGWERDTHGMNSSFRRGYDGWLYATHGFNNNSTIRGKDGSEIKLNSGNTYRIRIDGSRVEQHTWGQVNPFGLCFDPLGNLYSADCHSAPIYQLLRRGYYPSFGKPHDGLGFAPTMMEHTHGSTAICGLMYYSDSLWPEEYRDSIYVGNVMTSRIHRDQLTEIGSTKIAKEMPDLVACDDPWFRPVDFHLGPDGALYILDFYNRIIGHYEVPLEHPGRDRTSGRIWRVTYRGKAHSRKLDLTRASADKLIDALRDPNVTYRMLAMDQITDRLGKSAVTPLKRALKKAKSPEKVHILWSLFRLGALEDKAVETAVTDPSREVRVHAMRILTEIPHGQLGLFGLSESDALIQRCAAEALAADPKPEHVPALLRALDFAPAQDTHLVYVLRKALRDHLQQPGTLSKLDVSPKYHRYVADVAVAVKSEEAGAFLVNHLLASRSYAPAGELPKYLRHAARYAPERQLDSLPAIVHRTVRDDVDLQLELFKSVQEGATQRGNALTPGCRKWGEELAEQLLRLAEASNVEWVNTPMGSAADPKNPWFVQKRASADGDKDSKFLCSLPPGGEHLTGTLRSQPFKVPARLKFFLAGHDGYPGKPAQRKNAVRLTAGDEVFAEAFPPRNDIAQPVEWDLAAHAGKTAILEVTDGDNGDAYAWLAIGRFEPPVVNVPSADPSRLAKRQKSAAELAAALGLKKLQPRFETLLLKDASELEAQAAIAQTLVAFKPNDQLASLAAQIPDAGVPDTLRNRIILAVAGKVPPDEPLLETLRLAPHRVQQKLAQALAGSASGAEFLLAAAADRQISPALLLDRSTKEKLLAAKIPNAAARVAKVTEGISAPNEALQKLVARRHRKFNAAKANIAEGARLFTQNCSVCHKINGEGGLVGPQLDGIGNRGIERVCEDIIDPNRNVDPAFRSTLLVLKDGDVATGLFRREEGETIILAESTGKEISIPKTNIAERRQSDTSLMPENFGELLTEQQFNDLLAYLLSPREK